MIRWADPDRVAAAVTSYAGELRERHPAVSRVYWYGSWVTGVPTPSSDADICVVIASDDGRRSRDRIPDYLPRHSFPVGIDLTVLTEQELNTLAVRSPSWHKAIISGRIV